MCLFFTRNARRMRTLTAMSVLHHTKISAHVISVSNTLAMDKTRNVQIRTSVLVRSVSFTRTSVLILPNKLPKTCGLTTRRYLTRNVVGRCGSNGPLTTVYTTPLICNHVKLLGKLGTAYCPKFRGRLRNTYCATTLIRGSNLFVAKGKPTTMFRFNCAVTRTLMKGGGTSSIEGNVLCGRLTS